MAQDRPYRLEGAHALVTGASQGIGADIARALDQAGATVSLMSRNEQALKQVLADLAAPGTIGVADVTDAKAVGRGIEKIVKNSGPIDILINNAGNASSQPFAKTSATAWDDMISLNLTSVFCVTQAVLKSMLPRGMGRIVNIASTAGLKGYPYVAAYCAAKHGVIGLTRALGLELARTDITVNAVCPGYTDTDMLRTAMGTIEEKTGRDGADILAEFERANPQNRLISPHEISNAVVWLCSPGASAMTGQALSLSGGEVM